MGVCVITPTKYSGIRKSDREAIAKPVDAIFSRPRFLSWMATVLDPGQCRGTNSMVGAQVKQKRSQQLNRCLRLLFANPKGL